MNYKKISLLKMKLEKGQRNNNLISNLPFFQSDCKSDKFLNSLRIPSIVGKPFFLSLTLAGILLPYQLASASPVSVIGSYVNQLASPKPQANPTRIPNPPTPPNITGNTNKDIQRMLEYKVQFLTYLNQLGEKGLKLPPDTAGILRGVDNTKGYITGGYVTATQNILNQIKQLNAQSSQPFNPVTTPTKPSSAGSPNFDHIPHEIKEYLLGGGDPNELASAFPMSVLEPYIHYLASSPNNPWGDKVPNYDHVNFLTPPKRPTLTGNTNKDIDLMRVYKVQFLTYLNQLKEKGFKLPSDTTSALQGVDNNSGYTSGAYANATQNILSQIQQLNIPTPPKVPILGSDLNQNARLTTEFEKNFRGYMDQLRTLGLISDNQVSILQLQNNLEGFQNGYYVAAAENIINQAQQQVQQSNAQGSKPIGSTNPPIFPTLTGDNAKDTQLIHTWQNSYQGYVNQMNSLGITPVPAPPTFPTLTGDTAQDAQLINRWKNWYQAYVDHMKALGITPIKVVLPSNLTAMTTKPTSTTGTTTTTPSKPSGTTGTTTATTKPTGTTGTTTPAKPTPGSSLKGETYASSNVCNANQANCASFKFVTNNETAQSSSTTIDKISLHSPYKTLNGNTPSKKIFGGIYSMELKGVEVNSKLLSFDDKRSEKMSVKDSIIHGDMAGSFNDLELNNSSIYGNITANAKYGKGDNLSFDNKSEVTGNITNKSSTANASTSIKFNKSTLRGNIVLDSTLANGTMTTSFVDSTWYGTFQETKNVKDDFHNNISLVRTKVNPNSGATNFTFNKRGLNFTASDSQINANLNLSNRATVALNKTDINNIRITNGTTNVTLDNSTVSNDVEVSGGTATFNLSNQVNVGNLKVSGGIVNLNLNNATTTNSANDATKRSSFTGKIVTNMTDSSYDKFRINMKNSDLTLKANSKLFVALTGDTGDNTLTMQDSLVRLTNRSRFNGTLTALGKNELKFYNSTFNLKDESIFQGSLKTDYETNKGKSNSSALADNAISIGSHTLFFLEPNANTSAINNASNFANLNIGFKGKLNTTGNDNFIQMDSSEPLSNLDAVVLILKKADQNKNTFNGTLLTKGDKNYLSLDSYTFNLKAGSFFDGVLTGKNISFNNPDGNVVLENGSNFSGSIQANSLTLKGATLDLGTNPSSTLKSIEVASGVNTIKNIIAPSLTSSIYNDGGVLNMNFIGSNTDSSKARSIAFSGSLYTAAGQSNLDLINTLYADPNGVAIVASNEGINNISYHSEPKTFQVAKMQEIINSLPDKKPLFNIYTKDNAQNNLAFSGVFSAKANIFYEDGLTHIILADSLDPKSSLNFSNNNLENVSKGIINGRSYQDGLVISIDGSKANEILTNYRDIYANNLATLSVDKTQKAQESASNPNAQLVYKATLEGILVGDVSSLPESSSEKSRRKYEVTLASDAAFVGGIDIKEVPVSLNLSQGSKVVLTKDSTIENMSSGAKFMNTSVLDNATLAQRNNTIIDLATNADYHNTVRKDTYSTLTINNIKDASNVVFRVSYGNNANTNTPNSDKVIIKNAVNSKDNYLQVYQNLSHPREIKEGEKVLLASVANGNNIENGKIFKTGKMFNNEGFDVLETDIVVLTENSSDPTDSIKGSYSNYYLTSTASSINQEAANISTAALNSNRSILLSNMNDINKRMGELRNNLASKGAWVRVFNGMSTSNFGVELKNIFTNVQAGYDYSLGNLKDASQYLGVTVSYGYNVLNSSGADLRGNANAIEVGLYYSYVGNNGFYSDSILKYAFINNKLSVNTAPSADYNTNAFTFGQEVGYRFFLDRNKRFYIDPAVEVILGYFGDGDISQTKQESFLNASMDASLLYRVKAGGNIGYRLITAKNETDFRAGLSYVLDGSTGSVNLSSNLSSQTSTIPLINSGVLQLGVNSIISDNWRAYLDLDVGFGSKIYRQDYLVSIGGRYLFGKKPRVVYNTTRPIRNAINPQPIETEIKSSRTQPNKANQN